MFFFHSSSSWRLDWSDCVAISSTSGAAVGTLAPAVAVAVDVAVDVEQRLGARQVEVAHLGVQVGAVAAGQRRDDRLRRDRLAASHEADLLLDVGRQRDGPAQRHLVGREAADQRVLHVEDRQRDVGAERAVRGDAAPGEVGRELAAGHGLVDELVGQPLQQVLLLVEEGQPARLRLLDDGDLDAVDHRQLPALEARQQRLAGGVVGVRLGVVASPRGRPDSSPAPCASCAATRRAGTARCRPGAP